jgi:hypothetical protein
MSRKSNAKQDVGGAVTRVVAAMIIFVPQGIPCETISIMDAEAMGSSRRRPDCGSYSRRTNGVGSNV